MDKAAYGVESSIEADHWWFVGRRRLLAKEIAVLGVGSDARVLDVGTSSGTNLRLLRDIGFRNVTGLDSSEEAIRFCAEKGLGTVRQGDVCAMPFADASFDLILATDIIEHVEDDATALAEIARVLVPGGSLLLTVPTFPSIWGLQDRVSQHHRRYRLKPLLEAIVAAGIEPACGYYFNYVLFVPIFVARRAIDLFGIDLQSENEVNSPMINRILSAVFSFDIATAPILRPPFGVSALVIAKRPPSGQDSP